MSYECVGTNDLGITVGRGTFLNTVLAMWQKWINCMCRPAVAAGFLLLLATCQSPLTRHWNPLNVALCLQLMNWLFCRWLSFHPHVSRVWGIVQIFSEQADPCCPRHLGDNIPQRARRERPTPVSYKLDDAKREKELREKAEQTNQQFHRLKPELWGKYVRALK